MVYGFGELIEIWVVCNMTLAYSLGHIAHKLNCNWLLILIIAYAIERVLEMFAYVETIIGMFMNIICLARFVGMLPEVKEKGSN